MWEAPHLSPQNIRALYHHPSVVSFMKEDVMNSVLGEFGVGTVKELALARHVP